MEKPRLLVLSHSSINNDPRILRHIEIVSDIFEVLTCSYGTKPSMVSEHFQIESNVRYLPRTIPELLKIQIGGSSSVARKSSFTNAIVGNLEGLDFDAVLANDVHVLPSAFIAAEERPVWVDMHEYAPLEGEDDWRWNIAFKRYVKTICDTYLPRASILSSVSNGICERFTNEYGTPVDLVKNSYPYQNRNIEETSCSIRLRAIHVGAAIPVRKTEKLMFAFKGLEETHELDLLLAPTNQKYYEHLVNIASKLSNVNILEPVAPSKVVETLARYQLGLISLPGQSFNNMYSMPNKLFQYVQARLPILTTPLPEASQIVTEFGIGWVSKSESSRDISLELKKIDKDATSRLSQSLDEAAVLLSVEKDNLKREEIALKLLTLST